MVVVVVAAMNAFRCDGGGGEIMDLSDMLCVKSRKDAWNMWTSSKDKEGKEKKKIDDGNICLELGLFSCVVFTYHAMPSRPPRSF